MPIDRDLVFSGLRFVLFGGRIAQTQVDGLNNILDAWEAEPPLDGQPHGLSYEIATGWHETGRTLQPIKEWGVGRGHAYGVPDKATGQTYYGRGLVQLTWKANYERADNELGLGGELVRNPDLALTPAVAAKILHRGMVNGWFTGRKLADYFNADRQDPIGARRIINGQDCAGLIAGYYRVILPPIANALGHKLVGA